MHSVFLRQSLENIADYGSGWRFSWDSTVKLACTSPAYIQTGWGYEVDQMFCQNVTFFHTE